MVDVPGILTDIMPDPARNRFYILRQDLNELLDIRRHHQPEIVALRTDTTPNMMTMSNDGNYLLVANDNSQLVSVFDLNVCSRCSRSCCRAAITATPWPRRITPSWCWRIMTQLARESSIPLI